MDGISWTQPGGVFSVVRQHCTHEELHSGVSVAVVIKGSPFSVIVANAPSLYSSHSIGVECSLLYDSPDNKMVDYVRVRPLDFKIVNCDQPNCIAIEMKIKVLTSQHEDMLFRVAIQAIETTRNIAIPGLRCLTGPIKVVSKPEQARKGMKKEENAKRQISSAASAPQPPQSFLYQQNAQSVQAMGPQTNIVDENSLEDQNLPLQKDQTNLSQPQQQLQQLQQQLQQQSPSSSSSSSSFTPNTSSSLPNLANILDAISRIEQQQSFQLNMLERLSASDQLSPQPLNFSGSNSAQSTPVSSKPAAGSVIESSKRQKEDKDEIPVAFRTAFMQLFQIYSTMSPEQKIDSIRKAVRPLDKQDCDNLSELLDMLNTSGVQHDVFSDLRTFAPQQLTQNETDFNSGFIM
eukprot:TRINITY_DN955_c1_g1_i2.p1 TRINITY_DN955_c1_g1~~TRINITY_DN955_c1_g1_i2.p1  ORF type:complete len:404 (+),score=133.96 TRINITY_DN955_c1_g1_i2:40-1251(+)